MIPILAAVPGHPQAVVVAEEHVVRVNGIDPQGVVVAAEPEGRRPGLAAVPGAEDPDAQNVDDLVVVGIDDDLAVPIARGPADAPLLRADLFPGRAGVVRAVDLAVDHALAGFSVEDLLPALLGGHPRLVGVLDAGVDDLGVLGVDREPDAAQDASGQAVLELGPRLAGIDRLVHARAGTADLVGPRLAEPVVGRGVKGVGRRRVHGHIDDPDITAADHDLQALRPGLAAVGRLVEPPFGVLRVVMAEGRDVDHVGILGVDDDPPDVMGFRQPHVPPAFPGVCGLVDAVAPIGRAGVVGFARADPKNVGIRGGHGDVADGEDLLVVEDGLERLAVVVRFPESSGAGGGVERVRPLEGDGEVDEPAALAGGADGPVRDGVGDVGGGHGRRGRALRFRRGLGLGQQALRGQGERGRDKKDDRGEDLFHDHSF